MRDFSAISSEKQKLEEYAKSLTNLIAVHKAKQQQKLIVNHNHSTAPPRSVFGSNPSRKRSRQSMEFALEHVKTEETMKIMLENTVQGSCSSNSPKRKRRSIIDLDPAMTPKVAADHTNKSGSIENQDIPSEDWIPWEIVSSGLKHSSDEKKRNMRALHVSFLFVY